MEAVGPIEFIVLEGVNDVEADEPEDHGGSKDQGKEGAPGRREPPVFDREKVKAARDGEPGPDGRQGQGQAEVDMGEIGEAFGQRIEADEEEGDRREVETGAVEQETG